MIDYLENSPIRVEVGPDTGLHKGRTGGKLGGITEPADGGLRIIFEQSTLSGSGTSEALPPRWDIVPHEFYHAVERTAYAERSKAVRPIAIEGANAIDPLRMGTVTAGDPSLPVLQRIESRAVRAANIVTRQAGQQSIQDTYDVGKGKFTIPNPLGTHTELRRPGDPP